MIRSDLLGSKGLGHKLTEDRVQCPRELVVSVEIINMLINYVTETTYEALLGNLGIRGNWPNHFRDKR